MRFIEENEKSPRAWYGGAIGALLFNGNVNTGLTLRTIWLHDGIASVRAGATLLMDSDPESEERETETKAAALLDAIRNDTMAPTESVPTSVVGNGKRVLLIDHEDSFVHNLAGYLRRTGASVTTTRVELGPRRGTSVSWICTSHAPLTRSTATCCMNARWMRRARSCFWSAAPARAGVSR